MTVPAKRAYINITPQVDQALRDSGIREGLCLVNAMHITASVFINDDERGLHQDYDHWLEELAPQRRHIALPAQPAPARTTPTRT